VSESRTTFDAIVIGSGSVGNPAACFLAQAGLSVLVIERRPASGQGDNKAAIGGVRATHSDPGKISTCIESLKIFSTWEEQYGFHIGWKEGGYCFPVFDENIEQTLQGLLPVQKKFGLDIDWVGPERVSELVPGIVTKDLRGGTFSPHDGQISSILAPLAFQREAQNKGAVYHFNERVTGYLRDGPRITGVVTDKGKYSSAEVVLAAGADAAEHTDWLGFEIPVIPDSHEAGISAPVEQFLGPLVVDLRPGPEGRTANFYFGQNSEGQIIFCYTPKELFPGTNRESLSEFRAPAPQPPYPPHLARLLPHDSRRHPDHRPGSRCRGPGAGRGHVRPGLHDGPRCGEERHLADRRRHHLPARGSASLLPLRP